MFLNPFRLAPPRWWRGLLASWRRAWRPYSSWVSVKKVEASPRQIGHVRLVWGTKRHVSNKRREEVDFHGEFHFRARTRSFMGTAAFERWPGRCHCFLKSRDKSNQSEGLALILWIASYARFGFHKC